MSESKHTKVTEGDEIDLLDLLAKTIIAIKKNLALIIVAFVVGTSIGFIFYQFVPKVYESKMLISSDILTESYSKVLIDNLEKLIKEDNANSLARELGITPHQASQIAEIEIKSALERPGETPENSKIYLTVQVRLKDNSLWPQIQNGIVDYFQYNEFVKIRVEQRKKYLNQIIEKIDLELVDLGRLKNKIAEDGFAQSDKQSLVLFDPTTVNSKILELNKEKINLQNSLETVNSIQVIEGFTVFIKPAYPQLSLSLVGGSMFGFLCVGLFIGIKAIRSLVQFSEESIGHS
jgi:uncharacterized protein involved in exopolysaccharide biosynthesis